MASTSGVNIKKALDESIWDNAVRIYICYINTFY